MKARVDPAVGKRRPVLDDLKTERSKRTLVMPSPVADALRAEDSAGGGQAAAGKALAGQRDGLLRRPRPAEEGGAGHDDPLAPVFGSLWRSRLARRWSAPRGIIVSSYETAADLAQRGIRRAGVRLT